MLGFQHARKKERKRTWRGRRKIYDDRRRVGGQQPETVGWVLADSLGVSKSKKESVPVSVWFAA